MSSDVNPSINDLPTLQYQGEYRIEVVSSTLTYEGWARRKSLTSEPRWYIRRKTVEGLEEIYTPNQGVKDFQAIWDDRATYFDTPPWNISRSLRFDGTDAFVNFLNNLNFDTANPRSFSFWIRPRVVDTQQTWYSKRSAAGKGVEFKMLANGRPDLILQNNGENVLRTQLAVSLQPLTWQHIVITYAGTGLAAGLLIYVNSLNYAMTTVTNTLTLDILVADDAKFGSFSNTNFFDGNACDFRIFNRVLTATEVIEIYNGGTPKDPATFSDPSALIDSWRFGTDDTFPVATDETGAVDGAMTGMLASDIQAVFP